MTKQEELLLFYDILPKDVGISEDRKKMMHIKFCIKAFPEFKKAPSVELPNETKTFEGKVRFFCAVNRDLIIKKYNQFVDEQEDEITDVDFEEDFNWSDHIARFSRSRSQGRTEQVRRYSMGTDPVGDSNISAAQAEIARARQRQMEMINRERERIFGTAGEDSSGGIRSTIEREVRRSRDERLRAERDAMMAMSEPPQPDEMPRRIVTGSGTSSLNERIRDLAEGQRPSGITGRMRGYDSGTIDYIA